MTSDTTAQKAHPHEGADADRTASGPAPLALITMGDADAPVCVDGVCRLPQG